jgi:hypothetical protein
MFFGRLNGGKFIAVYLWYNGRLLPVFACRGLSHMSGEISINTGAIDPAATRQRSTCLLQSVLDNPKFES